MKLPPHGPEPCASANSAISASVLRNISRNSNDNILPQFTLLVKYFFENPCIFSFSFVQASTVRIRMLGFMINKVEICGVNTAKLPTLTHEEKCALFERIQQGDMQAREEFIRGNLRLVLRIIQRFYNRGENADDLFQVGCIGLIKSIDNFDLSQNVRFSTYAVPMLIGEIRRYLRDNSPMRVSRSLRDIAYKALQVRETITRKKGEEPTIEEIAKALDLPKEDVVFALDAIQDPISLYEPVFHDDGDALYVMDQIRDDKNTNEDWLQHIALNEAMEQLGERERKILNLRFFKGKTQMEVSEEIHISQAQVSRIEKAALKEMRKWL